MFYNQYYMRKYIYMLMFPSGIWKFLEYDTQHPMNKKKMNYISRMLYTHLYMYLIDFRII